MNKKDQKLLFSITKKDLRIDTFRSGGKGGQGQNTTDSGVRITHILSGAVGESRTERSQHQNKKLALQRLVSNPKFRSWVKIQSAMVLQGYKNIEDKLDKMTKEENLKIEFIEENNT